MNESKGEKVNKDLPDSNKQKGLNISNGDMSYISFNLKYHDIVNKYIRIAPSVDDNGNLNISIDLNTLLKQEDKIKELSFYKNQAYWERNQLISLLSKIFPSHLCKHEGLTAEDWDEEWKWIVCVHTPEGQCSWHIHDSELYNFDHLEVRKNHWDGHDMDEKYKRLRSIHVTEESVCKECLNSKSKCTCGNKYLGGSD